MALQSMSLQPSLFFLRFLAPSCNLLVLANSLSISLLLQWVANPLV